MNQNQIWLDEINAAITEIEKEYQAQKEEADWFNNNTPGVGQTIDYKSYPPEPAGLARLKQIRDNLKPVEPEKSENRLN
jgi:hypothetical protein